MEAHRATGRSREGWLNLATEDAIEPDLPICDPHHHLWAHRGRYLVEEFAQDIRSGHNVVSTVYVEAHAGYRPGGPAAMQPVGETEFVEAMIGASAAKPEARGIAAAIVGHADLTLGEQVCAVLEAHLAASPHRFRGIRHSVTWDADPAARGAAPAAGLLMDPRYRAGLACLQRYGLSYDAWLFHPQLPELASLARSFPELTIVLNHMGAPLGVGRYAGRRDEVFRVWSDGIGRVAACPNVVVKLGGLGMPRCGFEWDRRETPPTSVELAAAAAPYVLFCIETFGPHRCMFESNFPVDKTSYPYVVLWNCFKRITRDFSPSERRAMFHDTAARVYRPYSGTEG